MTGRTLTATSMAFTDQRRRPLLLILLVIVPAYAITRSIAITQAVPRRIPLPGDLVLTTTMKELHGAVMAGNAIAFVAALCGVFVMQAALQGDRRRRMLVDGAFSSTFHAAGQLAIAFGWATGLTLTVGFVLRRAVGTRN